MNLRDWQSGQTPRDRLVMARMWPLERVWWRRRTPSTRRMALRSAVLFRRDFVRGARELPPA